MESLNKYTRLIDNLILFSLCLLILGLPFSNSIIEITASVAISLWLFKKIFILRTVKIEKTPLNKPIFFYLIFVALSLVNSKYLATSLKGFTLKTMEHFLLYFVIVECVKTQEDVKKVISAILLSCALIGIDGLWQYFTGYDFLRGYPLWSMGRIKASFKYPTGFGGWLITVLPLCISLAIFNIKDKLYKISGIILGLLLLVSLILSLTRGAWLAIVPAIMFLVWKRGDVAKKILLIFLLIIILGIVFATISGGRETISFYVVRGSAVLHRMALAKLCCRMFIDHPFFGHGVNTFMSIYENYASASEFGGISYAHNCYIQIAVETGVFSLLAFLWMIIALFISSLKDIGRRDEGFIRTIELGLLAGLLAYLTHSLFETNLYALPLAILFYYFLGVAISIQNIGDASL